MKWLALLCGLVANLACGKGEYLSEIVFHLEGGPALLSKDINVIYPPPQIEKVSSPRVSVGIGETQISSMPGSLITTIVGYGGGGKRKGLPFAYSGAKTSFDLHGHMPSGGLPVILNLYANCCRYFLRQ